MIFFTRKKKETANKPHYGDVVRWIERVIDSCETPKQTYSAKRLIELFESQYSENLNLLEMFNISRSLTTRSTEKWGGLVEKKLEKKKKRNENTI